MLQPITVRTVKSYQQDDKSDCVNLIQIEDEISATFELLKVLHQYNSLNAWTDIVNDQQLTQLSLNLSTTNTKLYCFTKNTHNLEIPLTQ